MIRLVLSKVFTRATPLAITFTTNTAHKLAFKTTAKPLHRFYSNYSFKSKAEYDAVSNKTLDGLFESLEALPSVSDIDFSNGVLTLKLGAKGTYVINRQPPNQQIWLSSPISGPKRYDFDQEKGSWVYKRDGSTMKELLESELTTIMGHPVKVSV